MLHIIIFSFQMVDYTVICNNYRHVFHVTQNNIQGNLNSVVSPWSRALIFIRAVLVTEHSLWQLNWKKTGGKGRVGGKWKYRLSQIWNILVWLPKWKLNTVSCVQWNIPGHLKPSASFSCHCKRHKGNERAQLEKSMMVSVAQELAIGFSSLLYRRGFASASPVCQKTACTTRQRGTVRWPSH